MYVNNLPFFPKFSVTLYADNTYLMLSGNYLSSLENKVNVELSKINQLLDAS